MDATHLHLILNHIPVLGLIAGFLILAWGTLRGYEEVQRVGLVFLLFTALVAIPVYLTGEPAEEVVEHLPGVSEQIIELHEDSAMFSLILAIVAGVLALAALFVGRFINATVGTVAIYGTLFLSFIAGGSMVYTANLGGQIRHTEIRQSISGVGVVESKSTEKKRDDDDH